MLKPYTSLDQHRPTSSNLVILRAGDASLHPAWLEGSIERTWDLVISYFGDSPDLYTTGCSRIDSKGPKWPALHEVVATNWRHLCTYEYVCLPDDDLVWSTVGINLLFEICKQYDLALGQPSLSSDSFVTHPITLHNPHFRLRFTNFVEVMAPCFRRDAFDRCRPTFGSTESGWGLDWLWPRILDSTWRMGIVDAVQVTHTRPLGGPNYDSLRERGKDPMVEAEGLLREHGIANPYTETIGGIDHNGTYCEPMPDDTQADRERWLTCTW